MIHRVSGSIGPSSYLINMISITKNTIPRKQVKCDKCGIIIDGGKEGLRKHEGNTTIIDFGDST